MSGGGKRASGKRCARNPIGSTRIAHRLFPTWHITYPSSFRGVYISNYFSWKDWILADNTQVTKIADAVIARRILEVSQ
jgi:hypothetical protein